jgi:hypothetical protein
MLSPFPGSIDLPFEFGPVLVPVFGPLLAPARRKADPGEASLGTAALEVLVHGPRHGAPQGTVPGLEALLVFGREAVDVTLD